MNYGRNAAASGRSTARRRVVGGRRTEVWDGALRDAQPGDINRRHDAVAWDSTVGPRAPTRMRSRTGRHRRLTLAHPGPTNQPQWFEHDHPGPPPDPYPRGRRPGRQQSAPRRDRRCSGYAARDHEDGQRHDGDPTLDRARIPCVDETAQASRRRPGRSRPDRASSREVIMAVDGDDLDRAVARKLPSELGDRICGSGERVLAGGVAPKEPQRGATGITCESTQPASVIPGRRVDGADMGSGPQRVSTGSSTTSPTAGNATARARARSRARSRRAGCPPAPRGAGRHADGPGRRRSSGASVHALPVRGSRTAARLASSRSPRDRSLRVPRPRTPLP